jgi:ribosome-binding protein aMBF1 (putative translation factor)
MPKDKFVGHLTGKQQDKVWKKHFQDLWEREGKIFKNQREELGLSCRELTEQIGISEATLHEFERGMSATNRSHITKTIELVFKLKCLELRFFPKK